MKLLIIGVNGFIGSNLARHLNKNNIEVYGTSSKNINNRDCIQTFNLRIGDGMNIQKINFDWVIHCVYDKTLSFKENTDSIILWAKEFQSNGVKNQLFISSIRSINGSSTEYSLIKQEVESWFLKNNLNVIRPGLVVGNGGLFKQMIKNVKGSPLIPLVNSGTQDVKLIGVNDLLDEINKIINNFSVKKEINMFYANKFILRNILKETAKYYHKKVFFITVPYFILYYIVRVFEILKINIGITSQNIQGLVLNDAEIRSDLNYKKEVMQILQENFKN